MTPAVIADSDGDESDAAFSPEHLPPAARAQSPSTGTTHPSASTDTTFFDNIFNEQRDAANEHVTHQQAEVADGEIMDGSSFDSGFQQTRSAGIHDKSPWDVPSSPEFEHPSKRSKKQDSYSHTRAKVTRGLRRRLDDIGYVSQEDEPAQEATTRGRKKKRVDMDTKLDDLVSTAPIESDPSFMVAPATLTDSQKEQYSSFKTGTLHVPGNPLEQCSVNVMSSGTATNLNTQRSDYGPFLEVSPEVKSTKSPGSARKQRASPPERGAAILTSPGKTHDTKDKKVSKVSTKRVVNASDEESGLDGDYALAETKHDDGSDFEEIPKPVEKKKQRGRPKKADAAASKERKAETTVKKKRGRPKKTEAAIKLDDDSEVQETGPAVHADAHVETRIKQQLHEDPEEPVQSTPAFTKPESNEADKTMPDQAPQTPTSEAQGSAGIAALKKSAGKTPTSIGGSGRPLYRVGLSKKTRIAPLLRVIRKEG